MRELGGNTTAKYISLVGFNCCVCMNGQDICSTPNARSTSTGKILSPRSTSPHRSMIVNSLGNYVDAVVLDDRQRALRPIDLVGFRSLISPIKRRYLSTGKSATSVRKEEFFARTESESR